MLSGHLPAGSKLLVLAPDEKWKDMMRARNRTLFESWEVVDTMDVDTAKGAHLACLLRPRTCYAPAPATLPHLLRPRTCSTFACYTPLPATPPYLLQSGPPSMSTWLWSSSSTGPWRATGPTS